MKIFNDEVTNKDKQLAFELKGMDECEDDAKLRALTPEKARQISEAARVIFEGIDETPDWFQDYIRLRQHGWPWRVATYIAWAASPREKRWPETVGELATNVLGLKGPRVIYIWRKNYVAIDTNVAIMQALPMLEHRRDVLDALAEVAMMVDYKAHNDREMYLEMTGDYSRKSVMKLGKMSEEDDLSGLSDAALVAMSGKRARSEPESDSHSESVDSDPHTDPIPSREKETISQEEDDENE